MLCPRASLNPLRHHAQLLPLLIVWPARRTRLLGTGGFTAAKIARATSSDAASSLIQRVTGRPRGFGALFGLGLLMTRLVSAFRAYHGIHGSPPLARWPVWATSADSPHASQLDDGRVQPRTGRKRNRDASFCAGTYLRGAGARRDSAGHDAFAGTGVPPHAAIHTERGRCNVLRNGAGLRTMR